MDRNKVQAVFIFGILVSFLVACGSEAVSDTPTPMPTVTLSENPSAVIPSDKTETATQGISATFTPFPTVNYTQQAWHSTAVVFQGTERAIAQQAQDNKATQVAQFSITCDEIDVNSQMSPNENWVAASCGYSRGHTLIVKNKEDVTWVLDLKDFVLPRFIVNGVFSGYGRLFPEFWSPDGDYLYFSASLGFSGGGDQCFSKPSYSPTNFDVSYGLFQLNLKNGSWVTLIPPKDQFPGYNIKFSPTGRRYAVNLNGITVFDIQSGDSVQIDASRFMDFIWSPDSKHLAYSISKCDELGLLQSASVYVWNLETNQVQHLFTFAEKMILYPESWIDNLTLRVLGARLVKTESGGYNYAYEVYIYDITKESFIFSGTATPSP